MSNLELFSLCERVHGCAEELPSGTAPAELPRIAGWEVAVRRPAVGCGAGDFVDVFETRHGLGVVFGDVFGENVDANLCTNLFRILLRAAENHHPPAQRTWRRVVAGSAALMNTSIGYMPGQARAFATLFFGLFDTATGILRYINAGHAPPLIVNKFGVKRKLGVTAPALGLLSGHDFDVDHVMLQPGEMFVAFQGSLLPLAHSAAGTFDSEPQLAWLNIPAHSAAAMLDRVAACEAERAIQQPAGAQTMLAIRRDDHYLPRRDTTWAHSCHA